MVYGICLLCFCLTAYTEIYGDGWYARTIRPRVWMLKSDVAMKRTVSLLFALVLALLSFAQKSSQASTTMSDYLAAPKTRNVFFSFAQLSDLHISLGNQQNIDDLNAIVGEINSNDNVAFVIVSGDVTEYGDLESFSLAKSMLDKLHCPYYVVPGNNDTESSLASIANFKRTFGDDKFRLLFNGYLFLGVNTASLDRWTDGHIASQDIDWMKQQLKNVGRKTPVFIVSHHPLKTGDVDNWFEITDEVRKYNAQGVISGHYHRNMLAGYDGIIGMISKSVLRRDTVPAGYTLFQMTEDSLFVFDKYLNAEPEQWAVFSISQKFYVEGDHTKYPRPEFDVNSEYRQVKEKWNKSVGADIYASPAIDDSHVYFGDTRGFMHCRSLKNGKEQWAYRTGGAIVSDACIVQNKVVFCATDNAVYCLDSQTGRVEWKLNTKAPLISTPLVSQGVVYVGASDGVFRAVNLVSGQVVWTYDSVGGFQQARPVIYNGLVIFNAADGAVYALRASDGYLVWKWMPADLTYIPDRRNGLKQTLQASTEAWIASVGSKLFFTALDGSVTVLNAETGSVIYRSHKYKLTESMGLSSDRKKLFCRSTDGKLYVFDTQSDGLNVLWYMEGLHKRDFNASRIVESDGRLYITTSNGVVVCMDADTREELWQHKIGNSEVNSVALTKANTGVVTAANGTVCLIAFP